MPHLHAEEWSVRVRRKNRWFGFAGGIIVTIAIFLLVPLLMPQEKISISNKDGEITIAHVKTTAVKKEEDHSRSFSIYDVTEARLLKQEETEDAIQGADIETNNCLAGHVTDGDWGTFDLFVYKKVPEYVWIGISGDDGILMNLADSTMTESFYDALNRYMEEQNHEQESEEQK